jgi:hypothetical protein
VLQLALYGYLLARKDRPDEAELCSAACVRQTSRSRALPQSYFDLLLLLKLIPTCEALNLALQAIRAAAFDWADKV